MSKKKQTLLLLTGFIGFVLIFNFQSISSFAKERYSDLQLFTKVLNLVQEYYVEEVDTKVLIYGAIKGMLKELDPHTNFLAPDIYKEFESETSGEFGGLGIEITLQKGILTVISPIEDTPAWIAGVKSGDKIVSINGESTKGLSLVEAAKLMKGEKNSVVKLGIYRDGFTEPKDYAIKRGVVKIKSVKYTDLDNGYGYIKITSFIENTYKNLTGFINDHRKKHKEIKGLVIDLRKNPGGLLNQATMVSDLFIPDGVIVSTIGRNKKEKEVVYAKKTGTIENFPIVVMIDEYSASASEILAGALQDNKRALIMGKKSFGKGSVQSVVKLGDGSGLKLTVARYYTPSGKSIQAEGIIPDVELEELDATTLNKARGNRKVRREKDIRGHLLSEKEKKALADTKRNVMSFWWTDQENNKKKDMSPKEKLLSEDFQIFQAFNYLKAWSVMKQM
ncbi:MAG: S41 family peptidase [Bdellovibrionaceae bacterium]|nr:S41 family peptidase [Pseudobdellovibrionaceae bacterium]